MMRRLARHWLALGLGGLLLASLVANMNQARRLQAARDARREFEAVILDAADRAHRDSCRAKGQPDSDARRSAFDVAIRVRPAARSWFVTYTTKPIPEGSYQVATSFEVKASHSGHTETRVRGGY